MEADQESRWPDLPLDLLGLVLGRLPFLADRICFGAVSRRLRCSIKLLPVVYPQLPWIVLHDGTLFDLCNNVPVYQVRLPRDASCYSAGDNMLFLLHDDGRCSIMNALSGDTTHLPELAAVLRNDGVVEEHVRKVAMSKSLPDHGPIIIALLVGNMVILSSCRPAGETNSCLVAMIAAPIDDISFYQDRLSLVGKASSVAHLPMRHRIKMEPYVQTETYELDNGGSLVFERDLFLVSEKRTPTSPVPRSPDPHPRRGTAVDDHR
ncbi:hypothetical protein QYE76_027892 [Lolium multiflorum]|uniref:F-box domain-containing protein n=1 Tax=Lolium multiflorum TaxID=4521 RepID=A0AAD8VFB7_LOLMU|nr:hypothetical protein QYE76_027892 [Lolium multiflorum]